MLKWEKKIIVFLELHKELLFFLAVTLLGVLIRISGRNFVSGDLSYYLIPWYNEIKENGGFAALQNQVGNYGIPYQFLIAVMTYIPIKEIYLFKTLSCIFDFLLAFRGAQLVCSLKKETSHFLFLIVYACILVMPPIVLNSSVWGQCDAIYVYFVIEALSALYNEKTVNTFLFVGIAFAFKLQAIFILPFLIYYYVTKKNFSILHLGISLFTFYLLQLPGIIAGRSLLDPFSVYIGQTGQYKSMWGNFMSFWAFIGNHSESLSMLAVVLTVCILGIGFMLLLNSTADLAKPDDFIKILIWSVWTCVLFLPAMHDRYGYLLDLLLLLSTFIHKCFFKHAIATSFCTLSVYGNILFANGANIKMLGAIYTIAYLCYTYEVWSKYDYTAVIKAAHHK